MASCQETLFYCTVGNSDAKGLAGISLLTESAARKLSQQKLVMTKKILLACLAVFASYFLYSFTSENEKYEIINEIVKDNDLYLSEICSKTEKIRVFDNNLRDFTFSEQLSVNMQKLTQSEYTLKAYKLKYFDNRQDKEVFSTIVSDCNRENDILLYVVSMPIVSPDKKTVLIKITEDCNCMLGGQSGTYLYKKINGKWKRVNVFDNWISSHSPKAERFALPPLAVQQQPQL
ncbi:MAG: hypothetical protein ACRYFX_01165 [Janthinobacterium lividum]